ncbi:MAG: cupin domain-containing protein [Cytophagaceae bacterium]
MNAAYHIIKLQLNPHPEGGYFRETYRAKERIPAAGLPERFHDERNFSTAIYFLLEKGDYSAFHRIKSDECWHFYDGGTLLIHVIEESGQYYKVKLGKQVDKDEVFQFVVPAGSWFASEPANGVPYALVGCTVAPGFDFEDFEMASKEAMLKVYPEHEQIISRLCR